MDLARNIKKEDFFEQTTDAEKIKFLLNYAILAPSFYNSQPWLFKIHENRCVLYLNSEIQIKEADPDSRNLYISLGCAIENLVIVAKYFGVFQKVESILEGGKYIATEVSFVFNNKPLESPGIDNKPIGGIDSDLSRTTEGESLGLSEDGSPLDKEYEKLVDFMTRRQNARGIFKNESIPPDILSRLSMLSLLDDFSGLRVDFLTNKKQIILLGKLESYGVKLGFQNRAFRKEMAHWVRGNFSTKKDGLPGYSLNLPRPLSFFIPSFAPFINFGSFFSRRVLKSFMSTSVVCVLGASEDKPIFIKGEDQLTLSTARKAEVSVSNEDSLQGMTIDLSRGKPKDLISGKFSRSVLGSPSDNADGKPAIWISVGRFTERLLLEFAARGFDTSIFSAAVQTGGLYKEVQKVVGMTERPELIFCVGHILGSHRYTPRFEVKDKLKTDK